MQHYAMILCGLTLLHLFTDGICGAVLARYAFTEPRYESIVFWFMIYNVLAFGLQIPFGYLFDKFPKHIWTGLLLASGLLLSGAFSQLPIIWQIIAIGLGNSLFHVAGGSLVLRSSTGFREPGIFVSSGAIGLGLGLYGAVDVWIFTSLNALITALVLKELLTNKMISGAVIDNNFLLEKEHARKNYFLSVVLLLGCVALRGFSGNTELPLPLMALPIVMAVGKICGGWAADRFGYRKAILAIFFLGFVALQFTGLWGCLLFIFASNMTMPLTLRLLHHCRWERPGLMFGLAAACLVPGAVFKGWISFPPQFILVLQFVILAFCGWQLAGKEEADVEF